MAIEDASYQTSWLEPPARESPEGRDEREAPSARALLAGLVDYAGLFPPAALSMDDAVAEYARWRRSPEAWMLGRFVLPAARLAELGRAADAHLPESGGRASPGGSARSSERDVHGDSSLVTVVQPRAAPGGRSWTRSS